MKLVFELILFFVLATVSAQAKTQKSWDQLKAIRNQRDLDGFKAICIQENEIPFESNSDAAKVLKDIAKTGGIFPIRALIYAALNCTDGADGEKLHGVLGNEILLNHSEQLIPALYVEKKWMELSSLPEQESEEWFSIECKELRCIEDRKAYFHKKRLALTQAKIEKNQEVVRKILLDSLKSDQ